MGQEYANACITLSRAPIKEASMQRNDFLESVSAQGDLDSVDVAENVTIATLRALGERLTSGEAEDLASALPDELAGVLGEVKGDGAEQLSAEEFLERVRNREAETDGVDATDAEDHVRAVMATLRKAVPREWGGVQNQLPDDFEGLFESPAS
jgi:uncharacterized protein (DUF2267 family)